MADWYVDGDNGDDGNAGTSEGAAFATIQAAVDAASTSGGDTIYVQNNGSTVYTEQVTINDYVDLRIIGYGSTVGDGVRAVIDGEDTRTYCVYHYNTSVANCSLALYNLELLQAASHGLYVKRNTGGANSRFYFQNLHSHDNAGSGVYWDWAQGGSVNFVRCWFYANGSDGISFANGTAGPVYAFCKAYDNGGNGITGRATGSNGAAYCCQAYGNSGFGFTSLALFVCISYDNGDGCDGYAGSFGEFAPIVIADSILAENAGYGVGDGADASQVALIRAAFYGNTTDDVETESGVVLDDRISLSNDPFVDKANADFNLGPDGLSELADQGEAM